MRSALGALDPLSLVRALGPADPSSLSAPAHSTTRVCTHANVVPVFKFREQPEPIDPLVCAAAPMTRAEHKNIAVPRRFDRRDPRSARAVTVTVTDWPHCRRASEGPRYHPSQGV